MDHPHHPAHVVFGVAGAALVSVIGFHFLFFDHIDGVGLALYLLVLAGVVIGLYVLGGRRGNAWAFLFLVPFVLSLIVETLYASEMVRFLACICSIVSFTLCAYWLTSPPARFWDLKTLWPGMMVIETVFPFNRFGGFFHALAHGKSEIRRVVIGAVIAVPFLFVIGVLFVSSDLLLQKTLTDLLTPEALSRFLMRAFWDLFAAVFFLSAGWTIMTRVSEMRRAKDPAEHEGFDAVMITTFLTLLNLLFIAFIVYQFVTIFGGAAVLEARGITYATYAREGFFQLLAVSVIVLAILSGIYHFTGMRSWSVRWLAALLVLETGVVIISALRRMMLYIGVYGLSVLRVWSTYAIVLIAIAFTVLLVGMFSKVRFEQIMKALAVGFLTLLTLSLLVNVEDLIVRFNFNRYLNQSMTSLDLRYLESLSSDAVPALAEYSRRDWVDENPDAQTQAELASISATPSPAREELLREVGLSTDRIRLVDGLRERITHVRERSFKDPLGLVISDYRAMAVELGGL